LAGRPPPRHRGAVIVIQRVRVRWSAAARGAPAADARRGLANRAPLPAALPPGDVVVHGVLIEEARSEELTAGGVEQASKAGLRLHVDGPAVTVFRLPGRAAYPHRPPRDIRLFTLAHWSTWWCPVLDGSGEHRVAVGSLPTVVRPLLRSRGSSARPGGARGHLD
jgi:hypothetical protein